MFCNSDEFDGLRASYFDYKEESSEAPSSSPGKGGRWMPSYGNDTKHTKNKKEDGVKVEWVDESYDGDTDNRAYIDYSDYYYNQRTYYDYINKGKEQSMKKGGNKGPAQLVDANNLGSGPSVEAEKRGTSFLVTVREKSTMRLIRNFTSELK